MSRNTRVISWPWLCVLITWQATSAPGCDGPGETDADGDGWLESEGDCNDTDPSQYPGAVETCDNIDNDCNGYVDDVEDLDGDGVTSCAGDCDDADSDVHPGAEEAICDGVDNDCDPATEDEPDEDGDGYSACVDCDDVDSDLNPGMDEVCDGRENDCAPNVADAVHWTGCGPATPLEIPVVVSPVAGAGEITVLLLCGDTAVFEEDSEYVLCGTYAESWEQGVTANPLYEVDFPFADDFEETHWQDYAHTEINVTTGVAATTAFEVNLSITEIHPSEQQTMTLVGRFNEQTGTTVQVDIM
jgi:hypothetical protein